MYEALAAWHAVPWAAEVSVWTRQSWCGPTHRLSLSRLATILLNESQRAPYRGASERLVGVRALYRGASAL
jgi:hypothetical protein